MGRKKPDAMAAAQEHLSGEAGDKGGGAAVESSENSAETAAGAGDNSGEMGSGGLAATGAGPEEHPNAGKREAAVQAEIQRLHNIGDHADLDIGNLGQSLTSAALDIYRTRRFHWQELSTSEQRDVGVAIDYAVKALVRKAVHGLAEQGRDSFHAKLEKYADKGGTVTLTMTIAMVDDDTILALHRSSGKEVLIIAADADQFLQPGPRHQEGEEEPQLGFEAGGDDEEEEHPDDDSDLAGELPRRVNIETGLIEQREDGDGDWIETGPAPLEQLAAADPGSTWRADKETGFVQRLPHGADSDDETAWEDIREATPEELEPVEPAAPATAD